MSAWTTIERLRDELGGVGKAGAVDTLIGEFVGSLGGRIEEIRTALAEGLSRALQTGLQPSRQ